MIKQYIVKSPYDTTKKVELGGNAEGVLQGLTLASSPSNGTHAWWQLGVDVIDGLSSVTHYLSIDRLQVLMTFKYFYLMNFELILNNEGGRDECRPD